MELSSSVAFCDDPTNTMLLDMHSIGISSILSALVNPLKYIDSTQQHPSVQGLHLKSHTLSCESKYPNPISSVLKYSNFPLTRSHISHHDSLLWAEELVQCIMSNLTIQHSFKSNPFMALPLESWPMPVNWISCWHHVQKADSLVIPRHCAHAPTIMC